MRLFITILLALLPLTVSNNSHRRAYTSTTSQWQTLLATLQQNPALLLQLRSNPNLLQTIKQNLVKKDQPEDQCLSLKSENARLKQMIKAFLEGSDPEIPFLTENSSPYQGRRSQRELDNAKDLLDQAVQKPSISLQRVLVTPTATWTTMTETTSYVTTLSTEVSTEVPLIVRGNKFITTIVDPTTLTVTATEMKTSSTLITPSPTWSTVAVTVTPTAATPVIPHIPLHNQAKVVLPSLWPQVAHQPRSTDPRSGLEHADVLEIGRSTSPSAAKTQLDRLKQAYAIFFAQNGGENQQNPIFKKDYDFEGLSDFDQQGLAAQARPVFVKRGTVSPLEESTTETIKASVIAPSTSYKVFTMYVSGKVPGEYTTKLSTALVGPDGEPIESRKKREAEIRPSKVQYIAHTVPPEMRLDDNEVEVDSGALGDIDSSMSTTTVTVTVTKTVMLQSVSKVC